MMDWLKGKKTYTAAIVAALLAANQSLLAAGSPYAIPKEIQDALVILTVSLGLYGVRSAIAEGVPLAPGSAGTAAPPSQPSNVGVRVGP